VVKGYKRRTFVSDSRRPVFLEMLGGLCAATSVVCYYEYDAVLFKTAFVLGFFCAFRISEPMPGSKYGCSGIRYDQVLVEQSAVHIWLQRSKMDQCGRESWITLRAQGDAVVCPVSIVRQFLGVRPQGGGYFLKYLNLVPLSK